MNANDYTARPLFRFVGILVSLPMLIFGGLALGAEGSWKDGHTWKFGISAVVMGLCFLIVGVRGHLFGRKK